MRRNKKVISRLSPDNAEIIIIIIIADVMA